MVEIGGKPILWHIMRGYHAHGISEFIICLGYKGYVIKEWFQNYHLHTADVTFDLETNTATMHRAAAEPWKVTLVETGLETMTGGRLRRVRAYIGDQLFCFTYGDAVSTVDIRALIAFHEAHGKAATVTAVSPPGRFGALDLAGDVVRGFREKPTGDHQLINGGFFVLQPSVIDLIDGDATTWEREPMERLAQTGELMAFRHAGFGSQWTHCVKSGCSTICGPPAWRPGGLIDASLTVDERLTIHGATMRILITGNMGYVGPVLVRHLRNRYPAADLVGFDMGYFAHCLTGNGMFPEAALSTQHFGDVRELPAELLTHTDAVVHLAAISNDPMGKQFEAATDSINRVSSLRLARLASEAGVRNFVFASSCSVYGFAEGRARTEHDPVNPLTAYARSKIETEQGLAALANGRMAVTSLRFATACGMSDRLRLDLVLNDFAACASIYNEITVMSDGTPWRPLIDVADMARAIDWAASRGIEQGGTVLTVNAGSDRWNLRVSDLAEACSKVFGGTRVSINKDAPPDKRSYAVDFRRFANWRPNTSHWSNWTRASADCATVWRRCRSGR